MNISGVSRFAEAANALRNTATSAAENVISSVHAGRVITNGVEIVDATLDQGTRPLSSQEQALAKEYFGDSIDLNRVTINESSLLSVGNQYFPGNDNSRPFVIGNTINYPSKIDLDDPGDRGVFLHELTHVFQFQNTHGVNVQIQGAQLATDPSNYEIDTDLLGDVDNFHEKFNIEQQAEVVRGYFLLERVEELNNEKRELFSDPLNDRSDEIEKVDEEIAQIERTGLYQDLKGAGLSSKDLQPFIDEIQSFTPREGVVAEANEALDEIVQSNGNPLEVVEGTLEVGREIGKSGLETGGNAIVDGVNGAGEFVEDVSDVLNGRFNPFG